MLDLIQHPLAPLHAIALTTCGEKPHFRPRSPSKTPDLQRYSPKP